MTRVLVVDDDAGIRSIVAELLEDEGCTVGTAGDGLKHSNAPVKRPRQRFCWI